MWWYEGRLLDDVSEVMTDMVTTNTLTLPRLSREHLYRVLTCQATNSNLTAPLAAAVTIDMTFPPSRVEILHSVKPLSDGRRYSIVCEATGSRPRSTLTWYKSGILMTDTLGEKPNEGDVVRSTLHLTPTWMDDKAELSCSASNPILSEVDPIVDIRIIQVYYQPRLHLRPGQSLDMFDIEEDDDVYFECSVQANPPISRVQWFQNGIELIHNVSAGVIQSNLSLVLQGVGRASSGFYTCQAHNIEGTGKSNAVRLNVKYSPVCVMDQPIVYGGGRHHPVNVTCRVHAHPEAHSFRWAFNNSAEVVDIPESRYESTRSRSVVAYTPRTHLDFGSLLCWAGNDVGMQKQPCVFHVLPAVKPTNQLTQTQVITEHPPKFVGRGKNKYHVSLKQRAAALQVVMYISRQSGLQFLFKNMTQKRCIVYVTAQVCKSVPEQVHNCSVSHNGSAAGAVEVECQPGWDGGLMQSFTLEVRNVKGHTLAVLKRQPVPQFSVTGLAPGTEYVLSIVASNAHGGGEPTTFAHLTPIDIAERRTSPSASSPGMLLTVTPILAVLTGVVTSLAICAIVLVLVVRAKAKAKAKEPAKMLFAKKTPSNGCEEGGFVDAHIGPDVMNVSTDPKTVEGEKEMQSQVSIDYLQQDSSSFFINPGTLLSNAPSEEIDTLLMDNRQPRPRLMMPPSAMGPIASLDTMGRSSGRGTPSSASDSHRGSTSTVALHPDYYGNTVVAEHPDCVRLPLVQVPPVSSPKESSV
ncbi:nephrin-like [Oratosquilla oratoria]|uniref:nephrin-like n=1 Tax=Oratosquilla oratoria TaxID=337810 RepID=UPI003F75E935